MQESISCVSRTGSWQVHWVQCRQRFSFLQPTLNAKRPGVYTDHTEKNHTQHTPKSKKTKPTLSLFTCPDDSAITAASFLSFQANHSCSPGARDLRGLPASDRILSGVDWLGAGSGAPLLPPHAHHCPPPFRDAANRNARICRDQWQ